MKILLWLFPRHWRNRYRAEIADHLARSRRPVYDRLDLLMALALTWADVKARRLPMPISRTWTRTAAAALGAVGLITTAAAISELQDGITELPQHWWSTAATLPIAAAVVILGLGEHASYRRRA